MDQLRWQLNDIDITSYIEPTNKQKDLPLLEQWQQAGDVYFAAESSALSDVYKQAVTKLLDCIKPTLTERPILHEGGIYYGCWLESTGTINTELLARFLPQVAEETYLGFAKFQREDGMLPYKITKDGASYRQIQLVTPLARCVWHYYQLNGQSADFLSTMYAAMVKYDEWLMTYRNTRQTGCIEAFSAFDTGHDLSPRFWHVADTPHLNDATKCNPHSPLVPFLAPDLTANVYCQRKYLSKIADELGKHEEAKIWHEKAEQTRQALFKHCYDEVDDFFYDVDRQGQFVRVQSDVLLRVLACEAVDDEMFARMLSKYLLNSRKFFAKYPFPSIALDDPRFDPNISYNSWAGPTNFLAIIRAAHAFEHHKRYVEQLWTMQPIVAAMTRFKRFSQTISPWTGAEGFTEVYSPAILCVLDFIERLSGILPTKEHTIWFTGVLPYDSDHGESITGNLVYRRQAFGHRYEFVNEQERCEIWRNDELHAVFPAGLRAVLNEQGELLSLIGMQYGTISGEVQYDGKTVEVAINGNEEWLWEDGSLVCHRQPGVVHPTY
ncbi:MGH1-like glycoside hydrolase domain-containing protein [Paenibacillus sp. FSL W7-1287]|uniref:MGH1-like glycoside hydrolase domain-containing protein n=1 Tax=Paenibacillus sp. FSL W7-1287 TaxID=2954538 RepID=UPI0030F6C58E